MKKIILKKISQFIINDSNTLSLIKKYDSKRFFHSLRVIICLIGYYPPVK